MEYGYSIDGDEHFHGRFASIGEALGEAQDDVERDDDEVNGQRKVWVGEVHDAFEYLTSCNMDNAVRYMLESIVEEVDAEMGAEEAVFKEPTQVEIAELVSKIREWFAARADKPTWYGVENAVLHTIIINESGRK